MSLTVTYTEEVTPEFFGDPIQVSLTLPRAPPAIDEEGKRNRIPISLFISKNGGNTHFGSYVYSIYDYNRKQVHSTVLHSAEDEVLDFTMRLSKFVSAKFQTPSYVSVSCSVSLEESVLYLESLLKLMESKFSRHED